MRFVQLAEKLGLPKIVSIQNSYSLLVRCSLGTVWQCMHGFRPLQPLLQCWPCTEMTIMLALALLSDGHREEYEHYSDVSCVPHRG